MARFIKLPQKDGNNIVLLNTDYVIKAKYHHNGDNAPFYSVILEVEKNGRTELLTIDFETKAEAMKFMESNFLIFNS